MTSIHDIPLLPFYLRWHRHERSYGRITSDFDTFLLLLEELAQGHGLFSKADLLMLCKTVFLKPGHEEEDFERMFHQYISTLKPKEEKKKDQEPNLADKTKGEGKRTKDDPVKDRDTQKRKDADQPIDSDKTPQELTGIQEQQEMISIYFEDVDSTVEGIRMNSSQRDVSQLIFQKAFIIQGDDYLLPNRVLKQAWRSMRTLQEVGPKRTLDVEKTVRKVAETGFLGKPVLKADAQNTATLTILIDASPSMVAFSGLAEKVIRTAQQDRHFKDLKVFYFDNVPGDYLFRDSILQDPIDIAEFLKLPRTSVLVFSDTGAARGLMNWDRVTESLAFIDLINAPHFVWVNPMPRERWENTTAEVVALKTKAMFAIDPLEFRNAIKMLRGKLRR